MDVIVPFLRHSTSGAGKTYKDFLSEGIILELRDTPLLFNLLPIEILKMLINYIPKGIYRNLLKCYDKRWTECEKHPNIVNNIVKDVAIQIRSIADQASKDGHGNILDWCVERGVILTEYYVKNMIANTNPSGLQWFINNPAAQEVAKKANLMRIFGTMPKEYIVHLQTLGWPIDNDFKSQIYEGDVIENLLLLPIEYILGVTNISYAFVKNAHKILHYYITNHTKELIDAATISKHCVIMYMSSYNGNELHAQNIRTFLLFQSELANCNEILYAITNKMILGYDKYILLNTLYKPLLINFKPDDKLISQLLRFFEPYEILSKGHKLNLEHWEQIMLTRQNIDILKYKEFNIMPNEDVMGQLLSKIIKPIKLTIYEEFLKYVKPSRKYLDDYLASLPKDVQEKFIFTFPSLRTWEKYDVFFGSLFYMLHWIYYSEIYNVT